MTEHVKQDRESSAGVGRTSRVEHGRNAGMPAFRRPGPAPLTAMGNQLVQRLFAEGAIQAKLAVSEPSDPDEMEADRVADQVMRMAKPEPIRSAPAMIHRKCAACEAGGAPCPRCEEDEGLRRKEKYGHAPRATSAVHSQIAALRGGGQPLSLSVRAFFEPRFDRDFSDVRVHTDGSAAESARAIQARAFTYGNHVAFAAGEFAPDSSQGRQLLAHELAHTLQARPVIARKGELDATNTSLWDQFASEGARKRMPDIYGRLVAGAPAASQAVEKSIKDAGAPKTDTERAVLKQRLETLVRVNAVGLMASHRAGVENRRDVTLGSQTDEEDTRSAATAEKETASQIRSAIDKIRQLRAMREELKGFRSALNGVRADALKGLTFPVEDWFRTIADNSSKYLSPDKRAYLRERSQTVTTIKDRKMMRLFVYFMAESLTKWREQQIEGTSSAVDAIYKAYPFFTQWEDFLSMPAIVVGPVDDRKMMQEVAKAYAQLLNKIDDATVRIGSGDIEAFDLPVPVEQTKAGLPEDLRKEFDTILKEREAKKFLGELLAGGVSFALVFIPVIGPALAAAAGVAMLGMSLEDMLDKAALSGAATNEQGVMLGVSGPKDYEWAMLAVEAALTVADLAMVAREFRAGKSLAHAADDLRPKPGTHAEPHPSSKALSPEERLASNKEFLEKTKSKQSLAHDEARQELELAQAQGTQRAPTKPGYVDEYVTPGDHGHVWRKRKDGGWCRWSEGVCYISPGQRDKSLAPVGYELKRPTGELPTVGQGEVIELPTGERVWRSKPVSGEDQAVMIESKLGPGTKRQKFEQDMFSRSEMDPDYVKSNMERAHSQGAGTGHESPYAITYAPAEVNQALQNTGIELYLRQLVKNKPKGVDYHLITGTTVHQGSRRLKSITYRVDVSAAGNRKRLFELKIEVSDAVTNPSVRITEPWINPDPSLIGALPLNELPDDIAGRLQYIFSKGASFPAATPPAK